MTDPMATTCPISGCDKPGTLLRQMRRECGHRYLEPRQFCTEHGAAGNKATRPTPCETCGEWSPMVMTLDGSTPCIDVVY